MYVYIERERAMRSLRISADDAVCAVRCSSNAAIAAFHLDHCAGPSLPFL